MNVIPSAAWHRDVVTDSSERRRDEEFKLAYAARMMLVTAAIFVVAGAVWLITGTSALVGAVFVAIGLVTAALARLLLGRIGPGSPQP